ncbi:hypothetical protein RB25_11625 [Herbaspirillum rubrisubalbicans]|uniref:hypothetical protein n=1 Tax=Herbaspirillum rubrisubalbicans TaxID=80842 RepID=UPI000DC5004D|nr:hypothetical protein [Herbaspirillum rubrisubalbicans]RAN48428.1 hypothetical protein RB25_11625 [Herbaspirillum rubrisubalbicans]
MSVDLRSFDYPLESLQHQRQWQLDAVLLRLAKVQRRIDGVQKRQAGLRHERELQAKYLKDAQQERYDLWRYQAALSWLARLQENLMVCEQEMLSLHQERSLLQEQCVKQRSALDLLESHRESCLAEFVQRESGRQVNEADRDWLMRRLVVPHATAPVEQEQGWT